MVCRALGFLPLAAYLLALALPLAYLPLRALEGGAGPVPWRVLGLTLGLGLAVVLFAFLLAFPLAWLRAASDYPVKRLLDWLAVLPLALPGYVVAYAWLSLGGRGGILPRFEGFWGAWWVLSLYTFPYLYLGLKNAFCSLDASLFEAARSLGERPFFAWRRVVLPLILPAAAASGLVVFLHVLADFGVVALMHYPTFSYAIYLAYETGFDRARAAWLALWLLGLVVLVLVAEGRLGRPRPPTRPVRPWGVRLGRWQLLAHLYVALVALVALVLPLGILVYWVRQGAGGRSFLALGPALLGSVSAALPAAALAAALALWLGYLIWRYPGQGLWARAAYLGYAVPPVALALSMIFFSLRAAPFLYQTLFLLIYAYTLHFLAEALAPVRAAYAGIPVHLFEAARTLGERPFGAWRRAVWPQLVGGGLAGGLLVFLAAIKELPMTLLLAPIGFTTLAIETWGRVEEGLFAQAAPFALALVLLAGLVAGGVAGFWRRI